MKGKTVSVYGYGRFGRFWADILADDFEVKVYSRRGLKEDEVSQKVKITDFEGMFDCDAVFYCVAISSFEQVLIQSSPFAQPGTLFFDTCSVKVNPAKWMQHSLPAGSQIVATHPMFGPDSYFKEQHDLPMVMCNISAPIEKFEAWVEYFSNKKMRTEVMTPDQHDEMVAYSQGITHYVGRVLADLNLHPTKIDTLGYKRLMGIIEQTCNDSWQLFMDLQNFNPYTKKMRVDLHSSLEKIYKILEDNGKHIKK
jgi:prephenate dehydrogenase